MIAIRSATADDLACVARVHQAAFPGFFLTRMGSHFLRAYYDAVLRHTGGILLVIDTDGEVDGFVAGFLDPRGFYRALRAATGSLAVGVVRAIARHPGLLLQIGRRAFDIGWRRADAAGAGPTTAELSSIGLRPRVSGRGYGRALVAEFARRAHACGATRVVLTTDARGNDRVNHFYRQMGFVLRATRARGPRLMNEYELLLESQAVRRLERPA